MSVPACIYCGKPACIFLTQISKGKLKDLALCKDCAKERGIFDPRKLGLVGQMLPSEISGEVEDFIRKMLESSFIQEAEEEAFETLPDMLSECPTCHYTIDQFRDVGTMGCPDCYKAFASELGLAQEDDDESTPAALSLGDELWESPALEVARLEMLLQDAIKNEDYEEAAKIRDRIRKLK